jgi:hypothetical protein
MATTSSSSGTLPAAPAVVREKPSGETMRAIILKGFGGLDSLVYTDIPKPLPKDGEVVIKVEGFGINHAEMHMRRGNGPKPPKSAASNASASSTPARPASFRSVPRWRR